MADVVRVEGLQDLLRAFRKMDKSIAAELRREYRTIGLLVAGKAKEIATSKGLTDSGRLVGGIRPSVRGSTLAIQDLVKRKGFPYPQVYEYGGRAGSAWGSRPFLEPAVDATAGRVQDAFGDMLDRLSSIGGFGGRVT